MVPVGRQKPRLDLLVVEKLVLKESKIKQKDISSDGNSNRCSVELRGLLVVVNLS